MWNLLTLFYTGCSTNAFRTRQGGQKCPFILTSQPRVMRTQVWNAGWCSPKFFKNTRFWVDDVSNSGGSRKFWWGGIWSQNLKNSDVFTKIETDFSAEIGNSNVFSPKIRWSPKKKKKGLHQNWDWFFGRIRKLKRFFRPKSGGLQKKKKKKKKKVFAKIETGFRPDSLRLGRWGGIHPEMEPNYSK